MTWKIPLGSVKLTGGMLNGVVDVLHSEWFSPGPRVKEFEEAIAQIHGSKYGMMVNSGTDALRIALLSLKEKFGWQDGDEVIVPSITFVATVNVILQAGLKPVIADVDPLTWVLEHYEFSEKFTDRTRCVIPVHMFGLPADMPRIKGFCENRGIKVIEDSCEAMGVGFHSQWGSETGAPKVYNPVGSFGDFACFSTYSCHLIVTGIGGLVTTSNNDLDELARSYANHGRDAYYIGGKRVEGKDPRELIEKRFLYHRTGYSARCSEFEAAVGLAQINGLASNVKRRQQIADELRTSLTELEFRNLIKMQRIPVNRTSANMMFPILLKDKSLDRTQICMELEAAGIETRLGMPLVTQPVYQSWLNPDEYPVGKNFAQRAFYVGCHPGMNDADVFYLIKHLRSSILKEVSVAA